MLLMLACGALLAVTGVAAWRWRRYALELPAWATRDEGRRATPALALAWLLTVALLTGLVVGLFVVGPAGRLAMRLLAATSPDAQGQITEAQEVIGEISLSGTLGLFLFVGLPFGLAVGIAYAFASFVLPRGIWGGAVFGTAALVILGSTVDPLRGDNPDFDIVGPGWLSVVTFVAMAVVTGILTAPIAGRVASALQKPRVWWVVWMVPVGLLAAAALSTAPTAMAVIGSACLVFLGALLVSPERRELVWRRGRRVLQAVLATTVAVTAPAFMSAMTTIIG
ncbi:MAG TPA: hypothetical protein PLP61_02590 [Nocardioides sp.]|uniref:hypothetical protein n=1 Tax=Nocardioides sp. TaxID=35761 RepID=UPI002C22AF0B|nr:hypothetical protein [Nocardioides sp.]HQR25904.1 hypothetical protein [Nocardioides sp.]